MMENDRKQLNKSMKRYEKRSEKKEKSNNKKLLDFQVKKSKKTLSATIDFSQKFWQPLQGNKEIKFLIT